MAPIFHVHGEDPEAVVHAAGLALDYRQTYGRDVVVEVICYRRHGHNEGDEPYFTQPLMYEKIKNRPPVSELYAGRRSWKRGSGRAEIAGLDDEDHRPARRSARQAGSPREIESGFQGEWSSIQREYAPVAGGDRRGAGDACWSWPRPLARLPDGLHSHIRKVADAPAEAARGRGERARGSTGGTGRRSPSPPCSAKGSPVRLSGQDVTARHLQPPARTLFDQAYRGAPTCRSPERLQAGSGIPGITTACCRRTAVLGFEYGYSLEVARVASTIWEAQFGDFANGAQVIIDQFIASGETKWERVSGLVMLLPHGYEGQGPEHSSARIERYLQLCADNNMQVTHPLHPGPVFPPPAAAGEAAVPETPHGLHPEEPAAPPPLRLLPCRIRGPARSARSLPDSADPAKVRAVLLCSGKLYYELLERKEQDGRDDRRRSSGSSSSIRCDADLLREALAPFSGAESFAWVQEEPANMGAWDFLRSTTCNGDTRKGTALCRSPGGARPRDRLAPAAQGGAGENTGRCVQLLNNTN